MSRKVATLVYSRKAGSLIRKSLLAYMADRASDDGSGIWASKRRMALEIEASRRAVIDNIKRFVDEGILIEVGHKRHQNGWTMEYRMDLDAISALTVSDAEDPCIIAHVKSSPVQEVHPTRAGGSPQDVQEGNINRPITVLEPTDTNVSVARDELELVSEPPPSQPKRKPAPRGAARGSRIHPNWMPSPEDYAFAAKHNFTREEINHEADQFRDYWIAASGRNAAKLDWSATWRNRIRDQAKYRGERAARSSGSSNTKGQPGGGGIVAAGMRHIGEARGYGEQVS